MVDSRMEVFSVADLNGRTDDEILTLLKNSWGYAATEPFEIIGRLKKIPREQEKTFFILEDLRNVHNGGTLRYPVNETDVHHTVFVGSISQELQQQFNNGRWIKARVVLSPANERIKHKNPFALKTVTGEMELLHDLPKDMVSTTLAIDDKQYIEDWVLDFYLKKHQDQIIRESEVLRVQLQQKQDSVEQKIVILQHEADQLSDQVVRCADTIQTSNQQLTETRNLQSNLERSFGQRKQTMEYQLTKLNQFIEQRTQMLLELDLISQEDADYLSGHTPVETLRKGHNFIDVFSADPLQAISYIQAFMQRKGIIYRRKVLEDFFALITTHDLIVLAGDSGSGKTNLIKSFAEAIGGKSIIVPVKPNWTSAEDLLGYYNPLEQKYLSTPFLEALLEATRHPDVPYLICLDEMNLARVEYYFADFLSLLEERSQVPEIYLYSDSEGQHLLSETRNFIALIDDAKLKLDKLDLHSFLDLLRDEKLNAKLHELCGFREGDSLLKYHAHLRKLMTSYLCTPSSVQLPANVRIIGAINVDETTHYLSPKILDRAHILRFTSPLLTDWEKAEAEVEEFELDLDLPVIFDISALGMRMPYPVFDRQDNLVQTLVELAQRFLEPLGIEFGLRTVRQARQYSAALQKLGADQELILNNIVLHKILPKLMFDGDKAIDKNLKRKDTLLSMKNHLEQLLPSMDSSESDSCLHELNRVIRNAEANDWVVNYWSR